MSDKGDSAKKQQQQSQTQLPQQQQQQIPSSSPLHVEETSAEAKPIHQHHLHHHQPPQPGTPVVGVSGGASPFIPTPLYVSAGATAGSPFDTASNNPKRTRYTSGQWKLLPSPSSQQMPLLSTESSPSPSQLPLQVQPQAQARASAASSSDTASSDPTHSPPVPSSLSPAAGQEGNKSEGEQQIHHQFRKGKYVSPVWKPHEMLWLARAWRVQYQGGGGGSELMGSSSSRTEHVESGGQATRGKTRADKDREVAEFLQRHGVNRDAKTAGTKWDNMLGEFRKVYEWERGGERQHVGKSYFRLSPYERKVHRLPASFDEEVFEELSQFMGSRMRTSHARGAASSSIIVGGDDSRTRALPPPPPFKEDDLPLSARTKQLGMTSGGEALFHGPRGMILGLESPLEIAGPSLASSSKDLRRIGKIRMTWEESVNLWAEEGELHRGRVRLQGSSFLKADELSFFDDSMVLCTMENFEDGPLKGFSVDRFVSGQQVKVFGRRKYSSSASASTSGFPERVQLPYTEPLIRSTPPWEFQDPTDYYMGCLRVSPPSLPTLYELSWHIQEPPMEELRFPLRRDVYKDLPQGKELFFTTSSEPLDCRAIMYEVVGPIIRPNPSLSHATSSTRESLISLWDDCINRVVSKFCPLEILITRKPSATTTSGNNNSTELLQDQWPNVTGFVRNYCLWRGEETDQFKEGQLDPATTIAEKLLWTYLDLPYILGYYAVGHVVTFCALSRSQDRITRTDLYTLDLSSPAERIKALVPCYRIGTLLPLLAERCFHINNGGNYKLFTYSDFERVDLGNGNVMEMTPNTCTRIFQSKRKWAAVKEIYEILDHRIPHAEFIFRSCEKDLNLVFKPRGCKIKPENCEQLVEALKYVTKALVALHDLSFMHRDLGWDKVMRRCDRENEWFVCGFDEAVGAPQLYPYMVAGGAGGEGAARGRHAPEMGRGLHTVKVDVWGVGYLIKTSSLSGLPKMLRELQNRCMEQNAEQRPTAADCYHHLLQLQSSLSGAAGGGLM
ncbi:uncharacterized protein LOC129288919 [Prosopis cineraria]|uniref:uncharacterized protein LOC129288919 n=1 Tax=Prosopis cineraria TaxID=364024 RepID=UPI00240FA9E0|nr:uncharacterized protein LOC129288919 [Prosopis cineraria]